MNTPSPWTPCVQARRRVAAALALILLAPPGLFLLVLRPIERDRIRLAADAETLQARWRELAGRYREVPIEDMLERERANAERLLAERARVETRARTLRDGMTLADVLSSGVEGRVDFKVTLFEARDQLGRLAEERGVQLPADLGIAETIISDEQAQMRLWQLAATVLLLERFIEIGVRDITHVEALDPLALPSVSEDRPGVTAYPVRIRFKGGFGRFLSLLRGLGDDQGFFALRSFWLQRIEPAAGGQLECVIVGMALRTTPPTAAEGGEEVPDVWIEDPFAEEPIEAPAENGT